MGGFIARPPRGRALGGFGRGLIKQRPGLSNVAKMGQVGSLPAQSGECELYSLFIYVFSLVIMLQ